ncbi:MAG: GAF domain-containing protein [Anaerolineaceae bacterium]|nr:GAF domain-containing protein [Anaerolineaceae bacterium]
MDKHLGDVTWRDWAYFGLRWLLLAFASVLIYLSRSQIGITVNGDLALAFVASAVMNIFFAILVLYPSVRKALPYVIILGDWITVGAFVYLSPDDSLLVVAIGGLVIVSGMLRLKLISGIIQAVGVVIMTGVSLGLALGFDMLPTVLPDRAVQFILLMIIGITTGVWSFILNRQIDTYRTQSTKIHASQDRRISQIQESTRAIYDMASALGTANNYQKVLDAVLQAGWVALREPERRSDERLVSAVLLYRANGKELQVLGGRGLTRTDFGRTLEADSGIIGQTMKDCVPTFGGTARKDPELQYMVAFQDARSVLSIPLRAGFDNYGVLLYGSSKPDAFSDEHTELLTVIGSQATVALQNASLYKNLQEERDRIVEVEEEARKKLARDLHDGPTQSIAAIAMRMSIIQRMLEKMPDDVPDELQKVEDLARKTTKEIRHMLFTLRPLVLENQGLEAALLQFSEKMRETHNQNVKIHVAQNVEKLLDSNQQGVIFYIVEEAVGNARKHAQAETIRVMLQQQEDVIVVKIADNGVGFDAKAVQSNYDSRGSLGMVNMRERTQLLDGTLRIDSARGKGTTITVLVPIKDPSERSSNERGARFVRTKLDKKALERLQTSEMERLH